VKAVGYYRMSMRRAWRCVDYALVVLKLQANCPPHTKVAFQQIAKPQLISCMTEPRKPRSKPNVVSLGPFRRSLAPSPNHRRRLDPFPHPFTPRTKFPLYLHTRSQTLTTRLSEHLVLRPFFTFHYHAVILLLYFEIPPYNYIHAIARSDAPQLHNKYERIHDTPQGSWRARARAC
jgi:hypothetical protein